MFAELKKILQRKGWIKSDAQKLFMALPKIAQMHAEGTIKNMPKIKPIEADAKIYCRDVLPLDQVSRNGRRYRVEKPEVDKEAATSPHPLGCG